MTHRREMAITSGKMPTSHTCHNTDEPVIKRPAERGKNEAGLPQ